MKTNPVLKKIAALATKSWVARRRKNDTVALVEVDFSQPRPLEFPRSRRHRSVLAGSTGPALPVPHF